MVLTSLFIRRTCHRFAIWQALVQRAQLSLSVGPELVEGLFFLHAASARRAVLRHAHHQRAGILVAFPLFPHSRIAPAGERERPANRGSPQNDAPNLPGTRRGVRPDSPPTPHKTQPPNEPPPAN